jgi:ribosomal protein S18 acetylase RimI-like enzyme
MSAQVMSFSQTLPRNLRPFDIRKDLNAVADLIEFCFADSLDGDGRLYIKQMRQAARNGPLLDLASGAGSRIDLPLGGVVWREGERVVGNLSLIPHRRNGKRLYLIANVAVLPEHRKRGIARSLTRAALADIERRGKNETWLQVDENNDAAVGLYRSMGFREKTRRTSWRLQPQRERMVTTDDHLHLRHRKPSDWAKQKAWLKENYPGDVRWQLPLDFTLLQPGLKGGMQRLFSQGQVLQWGVENRHELLGVLSWQSSSLEADRLWLASEQEGEEKAIPQLANHVNAVLREGRTLALNYPAVRANDAFLRSGFQASRTLIWMDYPWDKP